MAKELRAWGSWLGRARGWPGRARAGRRDRDHSFRFQAKRPTALLIDVLEPQATSSAALSSIDCTNAKSSWQAGFLAGLVCQAKIGAGVIPPARKHLAGWGDANQNGLAWWPGSAYAEKTHLNYAVPKSYFTLISL